MVEVREPQALAGLSATLTEREADAATPGLVFGVDPDVADWTSARTALLECYQRSQAAASAGGPIVYLVPMPAVQGHRGAPAAMLACALVSAARALAFEGQKKGVRANVLGYDDDTDVATVASWVHALLTLDGLTGDLIQLGNAHHGKVRL